MVCAGVGVAVGDGAGGEDEVVLGVADAVGVAGVVEDTSAATGFALAIAITPEAVPITSGTVSAIAVVPPGLPDWPGRRGRARRAMSTSPFQTRNQRCGRRGTRPFPPTAARDERRLHFDGANVETVPVFFCESPDVRGRATAATTSIFIKFLV